LAENASLIGRLILTQIKLQQGEIFFIKLECKRSNNTLTVYRNHLHLHCCGIVLALVALRLGMGVILYISAVNDALIDTI